MMICGMIVILLALWAYTRINKKPINKLVHMINFTCDSFENYINQQINTYKNYYKRSSSHNRYDDITHPIDFTRKKKLHLFQKESAVKNGVDIAKQSPQEITSLTTADLNNTNHKERHPIDEAITILELEVDILRAKGLTTRANAIQLGLEALKEIRRLQQMDAEWKGFRLPGEHRLSKGR